MSVELLNNTHRSHFLDKLDFGWKVRSDLYRLLSTRLSQKEATKLETLLIFYENRMSDRRKRGAAKIARAIQFSMADKGSSFAEAIRPYIPNNEYSLISAGEGHGKLAFALQMLLKMRNQSDRIKKAFRRPIRLIIGFLIMMIGTFVFLDIYVLPSLVSMKDSFPGQSQHNIDKLLFWANLFTGWPLIIFSLLIASLICLVIWSLPNFTGPIRLIFERFPPWSYYRNVEGNVWLFAYLCQVEAGEKEDRVLFKQSENASPWLAERLTDIARLLQSGMTLPNALKQSGYSFPSRDIVSEISISWGASSDYQRLLTASELWGEELEQSTINLSETLYLVVQLFAWGLTLGFTLLTMNITP